MTYMYLGTSPVKSHSQQQAFRAVIAQSISGSYIVGYWIDHWDWARTTCIATCNVFINISYGIYGMIYSTTFLRQNYIYLLTLEWLSQYSQNCHPKFVWKLKTITKIFNWIGLKFDILMFTSVAQHVVRDVRWYWRSNSTSRNVLWRGRTVTSFKKIRGNVIVSDTIGIIRTGLGISWRISSDILDVASAEVLGMN